MGIGVNVASSVARRLHAGRVFEVSPLDEEKEKEAVIARTP